MLQFTLWLITVNHFFPLRFSKPLSVLLGLISLGFFCFIPFLPLLSHLRVLSGFLVLAAAIQVLYRGKWFMKLLFTSFLMLVLLLSEFLMLPLTPKSLNIDLIKTLPLSLQLTLNLVYLFVHVSLLATFIVFARFWTQSREGSVLNRQVFLFLIFPISQYFGFTGWFLSDVPYVNVSGLFSLIAVLLIFAADIGLLIAMNAVSRSAALKVQNEILNTQVTAEHEHYATLAANYEDIRKMRHDIDNHLFTIKALLEDGKTNEASQYASEIYQSNLQSVRSIPGVENTVVASFILHKQKELTDKSISLEHDLIIPVNLNISDVDFICALGNLLDNAADACSVIPDSVIHLIVRFIDPYLQIIVTNPFSPDEKPKPRRIPELSRGVGSKILSNLVKRYDGYMNNMVADGTFTVHLYLKNILPSQTTLK